MGNCDPYSDSSELACGREALAVSATRSTRKMEPTASSHQPGDPLT